MSVMFGISLAPPIAYYALSGLASPCFKSSTGHHPVLRFGALSGLASNSSSLGALYLNSEGSSFNIAGHPTRLALKGRNRDSKKGHSPFLLHFMVQPMALVLFKATFSPWITASTAFST